MRAMVCLIERKWVDILFCERIQAIFLVVELWCFHLRLGTCREKVWKITSRMSQDASSRLLEWFPCSHYKIVCHDSASTEIVEERYGWLKGNVMTITFDYWYSVRKSTNLVVWQFVLPFSENMERLPTQGPWMLHLSSFINLFPSLQPNYCLSWSNISWHYWRTAMCWTARKRESIDMLIYEQYHGNSGFVGHALFKVFSHRRRHLTLVIT